MHCLLFPAEIMRSLMLRRGSCPTLNIMVDCLNLKNLLRSSNSVTEPAVHPLANHDCFKMGKLGSNASLPVQWASLRSLTARVSRESEVSCHRMLTGRILT
jgi:hypothetical protein